MTEMIHTGIPVQAAVTGGEETGDLRDPMQALAMFYRAFNSRSMELMERSWHHGPDVVMDNPLGGIMRGWEQIRSVYLRLFESSARVQVEFHDYTRHQVGDIFYAVGRERGNFTHRGGALSLAIRTTRIFRRDATGEWRQVHHHGSIDDPSLLADYQQAIR